MFFLDFVGWLCNDRRHEPQSLRVFILNWLRVWVFGNLRPFIGPSRVS